MPQAKYSFLRFHADATEVSFCFVGDFSGFSVVFLLAFSFICVNGMLILQEFAARQVT